MSRPPRPARPAAALLAGASLAGASVAGALAARPAAAQMFGLPVVQSPFPGGGFAVGLDGGAASDGVRTAGLALGLRRGDSRISGIIGLGSVRAFARSRPSAGIRVAYALRFGESGTIAAAPFAGAGALFRSDADSIANLTTDRPALPGSVTIVPVGVGIGYRRLVAGRAVAVHVTPQAQFWRVAAGLRPESRSATYGRVAVGADVAVLRQLGLSLAYERGGAAAAGGAGALATGLADGPRPSVFGVALSYAPRRPRR